MCYGCLAASWLKVAPMTIQQQTNDHPTPELLACFEYWAYVLESSSRFDDGQDHANGRRNPLTFATVVVAKQVVSFTKQNRADLTPQRMLQFLRQALRRMNSVEDHNPTGGAVTGVGQMPAVLQQLNEILFLGAEDNQS